MALFPASSPTWPGLCPHPEIPKVQWARGEALRSQWKPLRVMTQLHLNSNWLVVEISLHPGLPTLWSQPLLL